MAGEGAARWRNGVLLTVTLAVASFAGGCCPCEDRAGGAKADHEMNRSDDSTGGEVTIQRVAYRGWDDAVRLSNGDVEVVVVPSVARVMRYAAIGADGQPGANALWEDPRLGGQSGATAPAGEWKNFGGDKVWPWPQANWPAVVGRPWPPPIAVEQSPAELAELPDGRGVRLTSPVIPEYGVRAVRTIRLEPHGTRVTVESDFVPVGSGARAASGEGSTLTTQQAATRAARPVPAAVWEIFQLPLPDLMLARMLPGVEVEGGGQGSKSFSEGEAAWNTADAVVPGVVRLDRSSAHNRKIGLDADLLAAVTSDQRHLLTVYSPTAADADAPGYEPAERAQVYTDKDPPPDARGLPPYVEFEFTSPQAMEPDGTSRPLITVWELHPLPPSTGASDERAIAERVKRL